MGNNREVWQVNDSNMAIVQRTQYYPSGIPWAEGTGASVQPYKYNGKESIEKHGLGEYYSVFRNYYPAIGRPLTMDPLAEKYYNISPYAWCGNNFVNAFDPDGRGWYSYEEEYEEEQGIARMIFCNIVIKPITENYLCDSLN